MPEFLISMDVRVPLGSLELEARLDTTSTAVAIVGPSGAGKSTLLRILAGLEGRASGTIHFRGKTWLDTASGTQVPPWERKIGWVPQDSLLFPHLDVSRNLDYSGASPDEVVKMAELLGVGGLLDRMPRNLSGGERQRVALGRALLASPRLLLLDEPFSALDRPRRAEVAGVVRRLSEERGIPLVLISHDERDAELLADERWHLAHGRLTRV